MTNCILKYISKYFVMIVFKIHCKILKMYLNYYLKYMYFKILPITPPVHPWIYANGHCQRRWRCLRVLAAASQLQVNWSYSSPSLLNFADKFGQSFGLNDVICPWPWRRDFTQLTLTGKSLAHGTCVLDSITNSLLNSAISYNWVCLFFSARCWAARTKAISRLTST